MTEEQKTKGEKWFTLGALGWFVRYEHSDMWLNFKAYEVIATSMDGETKFFKRKDVDDGTHTKDLSEAEAIEGYVKWDGCMEVTLGRPHFCGAEGVADHNEVLAELHSLCLLLPSVDRECAGYPVVAPTHEPTLKRIVAWMRGVPKEWRTDWGLNATEETADLLESGLWLFDGAPEVACNGQVSEKADEKTEGDASDES